MNFKKTQLCDNCKNVKITKKFPSPDDYLKAVTQVKELLASGNYEMLFSSCRLDEIKDENGC